MPNPIKSLMTRMHEPVYQSRLRELVRRIVPELGEGDRVLDVGCGNGVLGAAILSDPGCPAGVVVEGLERVPRGGEPILVHAYPEAEQGSGVPFDENAYDVVIVADVLHHEPASDQLLAECARVAGRLLIIKDHQIKGFLAQSRISLIDWAANAPYGVPCLYRYNTPGEWLKVAEKLGMGKRVWLTTMQLYPAGVNMLFGRSLQFFAVLEHETSVEAPKA